MAISNTENLVQLTIPSGVSISTSFDYPNRVNDVSELVVQETTLTPRIADSITFNQSSDQFTLAGHNLLTGNIVQFNGTAITGFSADTDYYVIRIDANIFQLATSLANAVASPAVPVTTTGTSNVDVATLIRAGEQPLIRTLDLDVDYTATRAPASGLITSVAIKPTSLALSEGKFVAGSTLTIYRETDFKQESNYEPNAIIPADTLESNLDKLTMMAQQLKDDVARSVRFSEAVTDPADVKIPFGAEQRAGKILSFDSAGEFSISQEIGIWRSAWQSGRSYAARDLVFNDTEGATDRYSIYIAKVSHTSDSSSAPLQEGTNWDRILDASHFADQVELAEVASSTAGGASDLAQDWANKTNGEVEVAGVGSGEYSAKAYAIGDDGSAITGGIGAAKEWATTTGSAVNTAGEYSAKEYATGTTVPTGSAKEWANKDEDIQVTTGLYSSLHYNAKAQAAKEAAVTAQGFAEDARDLAQDWANKTDGTVDGVSYSAKHWATQDNVGTVATNISSVNTVATGINNVNTVATDIDGSNTIGTVAASIADVNRYADEYTISATEPASPSEGDLWYDSTNNALKVWTSTAWAVIEAVPQPLATTDSPTFAGLDVDDININGSTISSTNTDGDINITPDGNGSTVITSGGNDAALRITQTGTGNALVVEDDNGNPDSTPFVVDASGNIVSGSETAVNYGGFIPRIQLNAAGATQFGLSRFSNDINQNAFVFLKSRGTSVGDFSSVAENDDVGQIAWFAADGTTGIHTAAISAEVDGTPSDNNMPGRLVFRTTVAGASSPTERMRINSNGNVGIGTDSLVQKLNVAGNIRAINSSYTRFEFFNEADTIDPNDYWLIEHNNDGSLRLMRRDDSAGTWGSNLILEANGEVNLSNNKMRIDSSGNLKFDSGYGSVATAYGCRAWVNFRGTSQSGTATASGLVSGQYTATVTSASQFTVVYSGTTYTINTSGNHEIGNGEGVDLTVSGTTVTIDTQIRGSGNVSSITDNGAGNYLVNFTNAMPDANYATPSSGTDATYYGTSVTVRNTSSCQVRTFLPGAGYGDSNQIDVAVFR